MNKKLYSALLIVIVIIYLILSLRINGNNLLALSGTPYYTRLAEAITHGELNVEPKEMPFDLSLFKDKFYLYWGPAPVVLVLPFYLVTGPSASDIFYTLIAGIINCVLFGLVIMQMDKHFKISLTALDKSVIFISFALASPNLYLSLAGRIWHTNQIMAILYLLIFLIFYFRYLSSQRLGTFALSIIFFNLAWMSRYTLIPYIFLFIYPLFISFKTHKMKFLKKQLVVLTGITAIGIFIILTYNSMRFGTMLETGFRYQQVHPRYLPYFQSGEIFSVSHIYHNLNHYFFQHLYFSIEAPYIIINPEGNSIWSVYPLTLLLFLIKKEYFKRQALIWVICASFVLLANLMLLTMNIGTGWVQFGSRYMFDDIPLLFLILMFVLPKIPAHAKILIVIYGMVINILGTLTFYNV